jgi:thiamine-monophosphate kinase
VTPEDRFVEALQRFLPDCAGVWVGPGDDAAVIAPRAGSLAATTDLLVEGIDFLSAEEPERLGRRALAVNLSDLAAVGARPEFFLLSIAFPRERGHDYALAIVRGAISQAMRFGACLVGGDLSSAPTVVVSVALWGQPAGKPLLRSGARPGEDLYLSGYPGRAAAGLRLAEQMASGQTSWPASFADSSSMLLAAYRDPEPRIELGFWLAAHGTASAAIDVSDGLGIDAGRLARASGVRVVLEREKIPVHPAVASFAEIQSADPFDWILAGGDDYELLFTAPPEARPALKELHPEWDFPINRVGHVESGEGAVLRDGSGDREVSQLGYDHFEGE